MVEGPLSSHSPGEAPPTFPPFPAAGAWEGPVPVAPSKPIVSLARILALVAEAARPAGTSLKHRDCRQQDAASPRGRRCPISLTGDALLREPCQPDSAAARCWWHEPAAARLGLAPRIRSPRCSVWSPRDGSPSLGAASGGVPRAGPARGSIAEDSCAERASLQRHFPQRPFVTSKSLFCVC